MALISMKVYTVHLRHPSYDPIEDIVLMRLGFSWTVLLLTGIWMIWHRLRIPAAAIYELIKAGDASENGQTDVVCSADEDAALWTFMQAHPEFLEAA